MRARLGEVLVLPAVPVLLLVTSLAAGPVACPARFVDEPPRASPEELLRWAHSSKSGREHLRFGRLEEAEEELGAAFELSRSFRPSDARRIGSIGNLRRLAVAYWNAGRSRDFVRSMERLMQSCREVPGSQTDAMAEALVLFGSLQRQEGELAASREALELALSIRRQKEAGAGDIGVAQVRAELGLTWIELGDLSRAEEEIDTAIDIVAQEAGRENPLFASVLIVRAKLLEAQEKTADGEAELVRAVEIDRAAVGSSNSATLNAIEQLARFYRRHDRAADAEAALKEIVEAERDRNDESLRYAQSLNRLALFYIETNQPDKAESTTRTALEILEKKKIAGLPKAALLDTLATSLQGQGHHTESEELYLEALEESQEATGAGSDIFEEIAGHYAELLRLLGREAEAENLLEKLHASPSESGGSEAIGPGARAEASERD